MGGRVKQCQPILVEPFLYSRSCIKGLTYFSINSHKRSVLQSTCKFCPFLEASTIFLALSSLFVNACVIKTSQGLPVCSANGNRWERVGHQTERDHVALPARGIELYKFTFFSGQSPGHPPALLNICNAFVTDHPLAIFSTPAILWAPDGVIFMERKSDDSTLCSNFLHFYFFRIKFKICKLVSKALTWLLLNASVSEVATSFWLTSI